MLLRRYGSSLQSVVPDFDARALTEISFRRDRQTTIPAELFEADYEKTGEDVLEGTSEGPVQGEAEEALLRELGEKLQGVLAARSPDEVVVVESEQGTDYPKLRDRKQGIIVDGENRLHFHWRVEPPLRVGIYRRRRS